MPLNIEVQTEFSTSTPFNSFSTQLNNYTQFIAQRSRTNVNDSSFFRRITLQKFAVKKFTTAKNSYGIENFLKLSRLHISLFVLQGRLQICQLSSYLRVLIIAISLSTILQKILFSSFLASNAYVGFKNGCLNQTISWPDFVWRNMGK